MQNSRWLHLALACGLAALAAGCSKSEFVTVNGVVTWNGAPLSGGEVIFVAEDRRIPPAASQLKDGNFEFTTKPGKARVEIQAVRKTGKRHPTKGFELTEVYIPARYNTESTLTADVTRDGDNRFTFDLSE
jgi:hypothetical protein